jgi:hypothetical protein
MPLNFPDTSDPLEGSFNNASRALAEMQENLEKMKVKYGTGSQFYQRQQFLFECLVDMQAKAINEINLLRRANQLAMINSSAKDLIIDSLQSGIPIKRLLELYA